VMHAIDTCIAVLEGPVGPVAEVAIAAMGAAQGILRLDDYVRKQRDTTGGDSGHQLPPREDSSQTMEAAMPKLVRGLSKVLAIHVTDPAVMRQACQLIDAMINSRYKVALYKAMPSRGETDYIHSLLQGISSHRDSDDVAWQLLSTMGTLVQIPNLKTRLVQGGARSKLMSYPTQREKEMPRWLEGVFQTLHERVSARE